MARRQITILSDDLDGTETEDVTTLAFTINGTSYEIDLSKKNLDTFTRAVAPFTEAARRQGRRGRVAAPPASAGNLGAIREWARANGYTVSDRGRIAEEIQAAYRSAHR